MAERAKANRGKQKRGRKAKPNGASPGIGHNSDVALQAATDRWLPKILAQRATYERAAEKARSEKGKLGQLFQAAVNDGCNLRGLKHALELERRDPAEVAVEIAQTSRALKSLKSPLIEQYELFPLPKSVASKPTHPYEIGLADGKAGAPQNPPDKPGTEPFDLYVQGWNAGQQKNAESFRAGN